MNKSLKKLRPTTETKESTEPVNKVDQNEPIFKIDKKIRNGKLEKINTKLDLKTANKPAQTYMHPVCNLTLHQPGNYKLFTTFKVIFSQDSCTPHNLEDISGAGSESTPMSNGIGDDD